MADINEVIDRIINGQGSQVVTANALFNSLSKALLFSFRDSTSGGVSWGYYGGRITTPYGAAVDIAHGVLTLSVSTTNYVVAQKFTGAVSSSTSTSNWNDRATYWRLYIVVTSSTAVTDYDDVREIGAMTGGGNNVLLSPVTKTSSFTVANGEDILICNGSASITVTLPAASSYTGRKIHIKTRAAFSVISASSDVVPLDTGTAGTAILAATAGKWAELVSDGSNWVVMAGN
jgi:hypothetical protein